MMKVYFRGGGKHLKDAVSLMCLQERWIQRASMCKYSLRKEKPNILNKTFQLFSLQSQNIPATNFIITDFM